ncbi:MAG: hypothetical protein K940chlam2_00034 [Chlamydiae bacterium]|nr:hypothetical protein [Chlamydiota bacterium]
MRIGLTCDKEVIVDPVDFEYLNQWLWFYQGNGYAARNVRASKSRFSPMRLIYMHKLILERTIGRLLDGLEECDHANLHKLDNQRSNLRLATSSQNKANRPKFSGKSSKYIGVCWDKERGVWKARIKINGHSTYLGRYENEREAAIVRDERAEEIFGEFAVLNFP